MDDIKVPNFYRTDEDKTNLINAGYQESKDFLIDVNPKQDPNEERIFIESVALGQC